MGNNYFRFKQFTIEQDKCAMKVTTDACIQGAWTPIPDGARSALDIGAGTGLLSLMLAQRDNAIVVDAVEYDALAATQAKANAALSAWSERINILHKDVKEYTPEKQYDLIITNPPFFNNSLLGSNTTKNIARHTLSLSYQDILNACDTMLQPAGVASLLLPLPEYEVLKNLSAQQGWTECRRLLVRHKEGSRVKRVITIMGRQQAVNIVEEELIIYQGDGTYTGAFTALLSPFYLNL